MKRSEIYAFWGRDNPLSNWNPSTFTVDGVTFCCGEQFMMYRKAAFFNDARVLREVMLTSEPADHKRLGREVEGFDKPLWDARSMSELFPGLLAKFTQSGRHKAFLLKTTGLYLIEASPVDLIWGVGLKESDDRILDPSKWRGKNGLGNGLMMVRSSVEMLESCGGLAAQTSLF